MDALFELRLEEDAGGYALDVAPPEDWRLMGQERYLTGQTLRWKEWHPYREGWDHDHCEFCHVDIADLESTPAHRVERAAYATNDDYHWICKSCFEDFKERFNWKVAE